MLLKIKSNNDVKAYKKNELKTILKVYSNIS